MEFTLGGNLYLGGTGTEFGGIVLPGIQQDLAPEDRLYLWLKAFF